MAYAPRKTTFDPNKAFAWSYSKLKNFESCPKRHYHVDIVRDFHESESEQLTEGNRVHNALAKAIGNVGGKTPDGSDMVALPDDMSGLASLVNARRARRNVPGVVVATERQLAITAEFKPTTWFGRDVWYRAVLDVETIYDRVGLAEDWKTGKVVEDTPQLRMSALVMMAHHPQIERVRATFHWLKHDSETAENVDRSQAVSVWSAIAPRVEKLRVAYKTPDPEQGFPAVPNYLCRRYCPVRACRYHGT